MRGKSDRKINLNALAPAVFHDVMLSQVEAVPHQINGKMVSDNSYTRRTAKPGGPVRRVGLPDNSLPALFHQSIVNLDDRSIDVLDEMRTEVACYAPARRGNVLAQDRGQRLNITDRKKIASVFFDQLSTAIGGRGNNRQSCIEGLEHYQRQRLAA